jgi:hypothetical protein
MVSQAVVVVRWWRVASTVATLVLAAFSWREPTIALFATVPVLVWCWGATRSDRTGLVLLALAVWTLAPRAMGLAGRWVPSVFEVCVFLPILTVALCANRMRGGGWLPVVGLTAFVVAGILMAGYTLVFYSEGDTGDEGVWPGPSELHTVEGDKQCGSGGCARRLDATGDRAPERMRDYLAGRGFTTPGSGEGWRCRVTGLVLTYEVCAKVEDISPTTARVTWSI